LLSNRSDDSATFSMVLPFDVLEPKPDDYVSSKRQLGSSGGITDQLMLSHGKYREKELGIEHKQQNSDHRSDLAARQISRDKRFKSGKSNLILLGCISNPLILESIGAE